MKQTCLLICVLFSFASSLFGTELREVLKHPERFENRRITIIGLARVPGYFYLCADEKSAADKHPSTALLVRKNPRTQPEYRELDRQWVEVTGIMSDKERAGWETGPGILLEQVRVLRDRPRPRIKDSTVWVIFKNSTSKPLAIELVPRTVPDVGQMFFLAPHDTQEVEITEGRAAALRLEGSADLPLDKRQRGERIATGDISFRSLPHGYEYSPELSGERTLYYKVVDRRIEPVAPAEGRRWKGR